MKWKAALLPIRLKIMLNLRALSREKASKGKEKQAKVTNRDYWSCECVWDFVSFCLLLFNVLDFFFFRLLVLLSVFSKKKNSWIVRVSERRKEWSRLNSSSPKVLASILRNYSFQFSTTSISFVESVSLLLSTLHAYFNRIPLYFRFRSKTEWGELIERQRPWLKPSKGKS